MTMKCPACGKENADGTKFCKKCGAYLAWSSTAAGETSDFQPTVMVPESVDPDSDATVIRPAVRSAGRQIPASASAEPDPLLEALADRSSPGPSPVRAENPLAPDAPRRSSKTGPIIAGLVSVVVIAAAAAYWFLGREPAPTPGHAAAVVPAPAQDAASAPTTTPVPAALPDPVPAPAPSPAPEAVAASPVAPAVVAPAIVAPASSPRPKARPKPAPAPKPAPVAAPPRAAAAPATAAPAPAPAVVEPAPAVPAGPSSPGQACESKSFFAKPACMNEQCASPRFTSHPQCVELRERNRRRAEQEQRL
jgi:hypothetical protein